jgi:hypothetical protein
VDRIYIWLSLLFLIPLFFCNYENQKTEEKVETIMSIKFDSNQVALKFYIEINRKIYQKTNFGDPPQLAIWIENMDSSVIKTVWVSSRTAKQEWQGKIECLISLPYWESRTTQERQGPGIDAVSGATPKGGAMSASILVPRNSQWIYYLEVNASADYNNSFSYWSHDGLPDSEANGQPSLVYSGQIIANGNSKSSPALVGRTDQRRIVNELFTDLSSITTAKYLIGNIEVRSRFR